MDALTSESDFLLNTRFRHMARNTIDYWMGPQDQPISEADLANRMAAAPRQDAPS
ncbi:hypothetical protein HNR56_003890 [Roseospira marina]|nr:hypothetical protein [Roseospira marina]MBB5089173.1 hypothetical protein [Roseospira marina]